MYWTMKWQIVFAVTVFCLFINNIYEIDIDCSISYLHSILMIICKTCKPVTSTLYMYVISSPQNTIWDDRYSNLAVYPDTPCGLLSDHCL